MRVYKTPILISGEQKSIGGVISFRQLAYILGGGIFSFDLSSRTYKLIGPAAVILFAVIYGFFLLLAFYKVHRYDLNFDAYLMLKMKFIKQQKEFKYKKIGDIS